MEVTDLKTKRIIDGNFNNVYYFDEIKNVSNQNI